MSRELLRFGLEASRRDLVGSSCSCLSLLEVVCGNMVVSCDISTFQTTWVLVSSTFISSDCASVAMDLVRKVLSRRMKPGSASLKLTVRFLDFIGRTAGWTV